MHSHDLQHPHPRLSIHTLIRNAFNEISKTMALVRNQPSYVGTLILFRYLLTFVCKHELLAQQQHVCVGILTMHAVEHVPMHVLVWLHGCVRLV
jgi:hypothetical protein